MAQHPYPSNGLPYAGISLSNAGYCLRYGHPPPFVSPFTQHEAAQQLGYYGGIRTGGIKAIAAQLNGLLGGRPPGS